MNKQNKQIKKKSLLPTENTPPITNFFEYSTLIYGKAKIGKTTFCSKIPNALILATESGTKGLNKFQVKINSWYNFAEILHELNKLNNNFQTIIIDTVDYLFELCTKHELAKLNIEDESDLPFGKAWKIIKKEFFRLINKLLLLPYGVILISHEKIFEIKTDRLIYNQMALALPAKTAELLLGLVDNILYFTQEITHNDENKLQYDRIIKTTSSPYNVAGCRIKLPAILPMDYQKFVEIFNKTLGEKI